MQKIDSKTGKYNDDPLQAISDALYALVICGLKQAKVTSAISDYKSG